MRSKTSFFSPAVFKNNMTRFWPIWTGYLTILLFAFPLNVLLNHSPSGRVGYDIGYDMLRSCTSMGLFTTAVFAIISAMALYSYLYTTRSAGMIGSLPITRRAMFITNYVTGILWLVGSNAVIAGLTILAESMMGGLTAKYVLRWFVISSVQGVFFFSLASLCAMITGYSLALPLIYGLANFVFIIFEWLIKDILSSVVFGYVTSGKMLTERLTPFIHFTQQKVSPVYMKNGTLDIFDDLFYSAKLPTDITYSGWNYLWICLGVAVVFAVISIIIVKYRHMETATDILSYKWLRPVFRYGFAFGTALTFGLLVYSLFFDGVGTQWITMAICLSIFGMIGCFAAEMLIQKSFRVFKNWRDPIISAVLIAGLMVCVGLDVFGIEGRIPGDDASKVVMEIDGDSITFNGEDVETVKQIHREIVESKDEIIALNGSFKYADFTYYDADGKTLLVRSYRVPVAESGKEKPNFKFIKSINDLMNREDIVRQRYVFNTETVTYINIQRDSKNDGYISTDIPEQYYTEFYYDCIIPDVLEGKAGVYDYSSESKYDGEYGSVFCEIITKEGYYKNIVIPISSESTRINAFIDKLKPLLGEDGMYTVDEDSLVEG